MIIPKDLSLDKETLALLFDFVSNPSNAKAVKEAAENGKKFREKHGAAIESNERKRNDRLIKS
jgi:hypothetical protein